MLYIFDLDDTLIYGFLHKDEVPSDYDVVDVMPGRREKLAELLAADHSIAIVTNQGGVAFGYQTEMDFQIKIEKVKRALGLSILTVHAVCFSDARSPQPAYNRPTDVARRKPSGAMILEVMDMLSYTDKNRVMMIGDRPEDALAAQHAGVGFQWTETFFEGRFQLPFSEFDSGLPKSNIDMAQRYGLAQLLGWNVHGTDLNEGMGISPGQNGSERVPFWSTDLFATLELARVLPTEIPTTVRAEVGGYRIGFHDVGLPVTQNPARALAAEIIQFLTSPQGIAWRKAQGLWPNPESSETNL